MRRKRSLGLLVTIAWLSDKLTVSRNNQSKVHEACHDDLHVLSTVLTFTSNDELTL